ncbi:MAG: carboxypeptidase-like regulatory domain-containing protein [Candidatus Eremiobacteraeota bacterium]|nr:carboxypeptidase-like regulatory domain-containing protein [Candidatus Eremiobacteraeota bacterium]
MKISRILAVAMAACMLAACNADQLPPTGKYATFKGVVLDGATNQPVANATVTVDTVLTTTTASDGSFSFSNVPSGDVDYVVQINGYQTVSDHVHADPLATATVSVKLVH